MISGYWQEFIRKHAEYRDREYTAWQFGVDADELAQLVLDGTKTLTCSGLKLYEVEDERLPESGELSIVLGADEAPECIIENTDVYTIPFKEVGLEIAYKEGEGDRSLAYWREAHLEFFIPEYRSLGMDFSEDDIIVVEEFRMIYQ